MSESLADKRIKNLILAGCIASTLFLANNYLARQRQKIQKKIHYQELEIMAQKNNNQQKETQQLQFGKVLETDELVIPNSPTQKKDSKLFKICLTGGPCAGKTSGIAYLSEKLRERGFNVFIAPEAATTIFTGGGMLNISGYTDEDIIKFQINLMKLQMALEGTFETIASIQPQGQASVIICDRGLMDGGAYMSQQQWQTMLDEYGLNEVNMRDKRYDAVFHLVTAADGADKFYNNDNVARHETAEVAISQDRRTQAVWVGHPNFVKIDNHVVKSFQEKLELLFHKVGQVIGLPIFNSEITKKYIIETSQDLQHQLPSNIQVICFYIKYINLLFSTRNFILLKYSLKINRSLKMCKFNKNFKDGKKTWLRCMCSNRNRSKTIRLLPLQRDSLQIKSIYHQRIIQIPILMKKSLILQKTRTCFMFEGTYLVIDTYPKIADGFSILKIKGQMTEQELEKVKFFHVIKDITGSTVFLSTYQHIFKLYRSKNLSKKQWAIPLQEETVLNFRKLSNLEEKSE